MIEEILPPEVAAVEAFDDPGDTVLFPEEEAVVARAVDKRRREFTTARGCARKALATLGLPPSPILPGERGSPTWPAGVVGSMTHCDGFRAAAVARQERVRTVGLDAEPNGPLPEGVREAIATPTELDWLAERDGDGSGVCWDRLIFSAKESIYKAWFPLTHLWPGPVVDGRRLGGFAGRWIVANGLVATAITVLAPAAPPPAGER
jgi:enterobactin synthetase component D / holo-[acyl-carrier protein] synthase